MSNWTTTRCKVSGTPEQIREFREFALRGEPGSDYRVIDFHKIIPVSQNILALARSFIQNRLGGQSLADLAKSQKIPVDFLKTQSEEDFGLYIFARANNSSWNKWSMKHWGALRPTAFLDKVYEDDTHLGFSFDIPGGFPEPIFRTLGQKFPEMSLWCAFYEEDDMDCGYGYFTPVRGTEIGEEFAVCNSDESDYVYSLVFDEERRDYDDGLDEDEAPQNEAPQPPP